MIVSLASDAVSTAYTKVNVTTRDGLITQIYKLTSMITSSAALTGDTTWCSGSTLRSYWALPL